MLSICLIFLMLKNYKVNHEEFKVTRDKIEEEKMEEDPLMWHGGIKCKWVIYSLFKKFFIYTVSAAAF